VFLGDGDAFVQAAEILDQVRHIFFQAALVLCLVVALAYYMTPPTTCQATVLCRLIEKSLSIVCCLRVQPLLRLTCLHHKLAGFLTLPLPLRATSPLEIFPLADRLAVRHDGPSLRPRLPAGFNPSINKLYRLSYRFS
jgi:hypothetical protein